MPPAIFLVEQPLHAAIWSVKPEQTGNVNQHRFRLIGNGPIFDNPLILTVFG